MNSKASPDKATQQWEYFLASLPASTSKALSTGSAALVQPVEAEVIPDEAMDLYAAFLATLPQSAREQLQQKSPTPPPEAAVDLRTAQFFILECTDGAWPVVKTCRSAEALAKRISELEGTDTVVVPLYGLPMQFTKGPQRYLFLPGRKKAIQVPMYKGGPIKTVTADLLNGMEIQKDGYLGPDELVQGIDLDEELVPVTPAVDEEDEDDEEGDEAAE